MTPYWERVNARGVSPGTDGPDMDIDTCPDCNEELISGDACPDCGKCSLCCRCFDDEDSET